MLITVTPVTCKDGCECYYDQQYSANAYRCREMNLTQLPANLPNKTNWVIVQNNTINEICGEYRYDKTVTLLDISWNKVNRICSAFIASLIEDQSLLTLDVSNNNLSSLPMTIEGSEYLEDIQISKNPFMCNCEMLWMIEWLANATSPSGSHLVSDYQDVTCGSGYWAGTKIYQLDKVKMGCYPKKVPLWGVILLSVSGVLIIVTGLTMFLVFRRWNEVKFWIYMNFDILDKRDKNEDLTDIEFDALLSYR